MGELQSIRRRRRAKKLSKKRKHKAKICEICGKQNFRYKYHKNSRFINLVAKQLSKCMARTNKRKET